ncbi:DinB family protein [Neobacillus dielmonensis]|uniref:DinB family protein n=1 Tax=Neobacillus dielmonensis TaxID=1347369 RepID=UPI0005AA3DC1|nr:DinB family protein [Neobacillus dielmonensis]
MVRLETMREKLAETRFLLLKEISAFTDERLNTSVPNSWSVGQICHHLYLAEIVFTKAIMYGLAKNSDQDSLPKQQPLHILTDRSVKIEAPDVVAPSSGPFTRKKITRMLEESREKLLDALNNVEDELVLSVKAAKHPFLGNLPLNQWVETVYLHEQRHISQIREIKTSIL